MTKNIPAANTKADEPLKVEVVEGSKAPPEGNDAKAEVAPYDSGKAIDASTGTVKDDAPQDALAGRRDNKEAENSADLPVRLATDTDTQSDTIQAEETAGHIVAGAATGPDPSGVVRDNFGHVADAPMGSFDAATNGVHVENSTGRVLSNHTDLRHEADKSGPANLAAFDAEQAAKSGAKVEK